MSRQRRRLLGYIVAVAAVMVGYAVLYQWAMGAIADRPRTFLEALQFVVETFTTVGYGEDAPWNSPLLLLLVMAVELSGILFVFLALPLFIVPYLEERLAVSPPTEIDATDHVVITGFSGRGASLLEELAGDDLEAVVVEADRDTARTLHQEGESVVHGDPESTTVLERASVPSARAVVLDADDETNAAIALAVEDLAPDVYTVGFVEDPSNMEYLEYAGVDRVLSPRNLLGRALADRAQRSLSTRLGQTVKVTDEFSIVELPVGQGCGIDGVELGNSGIRERTGADVVGAWVDGEFRSNPGPSFVVNSDTELVVAGTDGQLEEVLELTTTDVESDREDRVVIGGYGQVGSTAREVLDSAGTETTVVDREHRPGVDVVGDVTERATLREADVASASVYILAVADDTDAVFSTLVTRQLSDDVEVVCRATDQERVGTLFSAGADYVLALATVSGRMLAATLLEEEVLGLDTQIEVVRVGPGSFAGQTLAESDIRARTGCMVVAVERDGELLTHLGPDFRIETGDTLIVVGTDADVTTFTEFAESPEP